MIKWLKKIICGGKQWEVKEIKETVKEKMARLDGRKCGESRKKFLKRVYGPDYQLKFWAFCQNEVSSKKLEEAGPWSLESPDCGYDGDDEGDELEEAG